LARLITKAKLSPIAADLAREELLRILAAFEYAEPIIPDVVNRELWFSARISTQLGKLRAAILTCVSDDHRALFDVCFSAVVRRASYADPRLSVPVRLNAKRAAVYGANGDLALRRLKALKKLDVRQLFWSIAAKAIFSLARLQAGSPYACSEPLLDADARLMTAATSSVDLIITSPPYVGAQKYIRASSLSLGWLGLTPKAALRPIETKSIGREHLAQDEPFLPASGISEADEVISEVNTRNPLRARIAQRYLIEMRDAVNEISRVLRPGGHTVLVLGPNLVAGRVFDTPSYVRTIATEAGLSLKLHLRDTITSRGLMTKRNRTAGLIEQESVFLLEKSSGG
jgi:hypothetical protein